MLYAGQYNEDDFILADSESEAADLPESLGKNHLVDIMLKLEQLAETRDQFYNWRNELFSGPAVDYTNFEEVESWYEGLKMQYGPHFVGRQACVKQQSALLQMLPVIQPLNGMWQGCYLCNRYVH